MDLLFVDLVNSEWYDGHGNLEDRLLDQGWRAAFLDRWGLGGTAHSTGRRSPTSAAYARCSAT